MGNTSPDNITYPNSTSAVAQLASDFAVLAASTQTALTARTTASNAKLGDLYALPAPATSALNAVQNITAGAWTAVPNLAPITINFARPAWVMVNMNAWLVTISGEVRAGVKLSGATLQEANVPSWGNVIYGIFDANTKQRSLQKIVLVNAGSTTFTPVAYGTGGGTRQLNYPNMQIVPLRWDAAPA